MQQGAHSQGVYRDGLPVARATRDAHFAAAAAELAREAPALRALYARRVARVAAGAAAVAGIAVLVFGWSVLGPLAGLTIRFLASLALAVPAYGLARLLAGWRFDRALRGRLQKTRDPYADLERLRAAGSPLAAVRERAEDLEVASLAFPMAAVALIAPLLLHLAVYQLFLRSADDRGFEVFDAWIVITGIIVGHAHCYLVVKVTSFAHDLQRFGSDHVRAEAARSGTRAWLGTIGVSALPGIVLLALPPLLVAVTGAAVIPALFRLAGRTVVRERAVLGRDPSGPLPQPAAS